MRNKSTDDLLKTLISLQNEQELGEYLAALKSEQKDITLSNYINNFICEKKLELKDVVTNSGLEPHYAYQIINGNKPNPSRIKVIALCLACHMTLPEAQRALEISKNGCLYPRDLSDAIIIYNINCENWSVLSVNEQLHAEALPLIE